MNSKDYIEIENEYGAHNYKPLDVVIDHAQGVYVYDVEGKRYLDCLSAYSAVNQGHCHPKILDAMINQAKKVTLTSRAFRNNVLPLYYKKLCEITGFEMVLPMNTGAEAVETAIKTARKWGYQKKKVETAEIIVCSENFHGRTTTIISFSTDEGAKKDFAPYTDGFKIAKYGDINSMKALVTKNTVAVLLEPIQGEAGIKIPPDGYLKEVRELCNENNILMILDEIQTGFCRTGKLFAFEHENIRPDIVTVGKALSGGFYPISAVLSSREILSIFKAGEHGSTFGGSPMAAAIGMAALDLLIDENLAQNSKILGEYFLSQLKTIKNSKIKEIRGRGLFIAIEMIEPARKYCEELYKNHGILVKETHEGTIRIAPPLIITKEQIDEAMKGLRAVFEG